MGSAAAASRPRTTSSAVGVAPRRALPSGVAACGVPACGVPLGVADWLSLSTAAQSVRTLASSEAASLPEAPDAQSSPATDSSATRAC